MSVRYKVNGSVITIPTGGEGGNANVWQGTLAEYQEEKETIEDGTVILINDDMTSATQLSATAVSYDNTESKLESDNIQGAIDGISQNLNNINVYVSEDGKLHFVDKDGADTELPFSSGLDINNAIFNQENVTYNTPRDISIDLTDAKALITWWSTTLDGFSISNVENGIVTPLFQKKVNVSSKNNNTITITQSWASGTHTISIVVLK